MNALEGILQSITAHREELVAVVVHLNDTYLIEERPDRKLPGFARLIATVNRLRAHVENTVGPDHFLVVHSGDFLGPSLLAKYDKGEAMVELLEKVGLNYCVLGNHEFDHNADILAERVNRKNFKVLVANATDPTHLVKISAGTWWPGEKPIVALTGVVSESVAKSFRSPDLNTLFKETHPWRVTPPNEALIRFLEISRDALFRIVLSHSTQEEDRQLRRQIPQLSRTYILGGHDHDIEWIEDDRDVFVMKNLANAETVRVLLLLAGGESVVRDVFVRHERLQEARRVEGKSDEAATPQYPQDLETVLLMTSNIDSRVIRNRIVQAENMSGPFDDLAEALIAAHYQPDILTTKLLFDDHETPASIDVGYVAKALKVTEQLDDTFVVRDFTRVATGKLEARDSHIRRQPTNFGVFVAECVRLHANADIAIINSGAFRCDSELDPKLHVRDLREAFLYDTDDAMIVLDLSSAVVDALLKHGASKGGSGAYPQFSDSRKGAVDNVTVAIASYLVTRHDSIDGYDEVLRKFWGSPTVAEARERAGAAIKTRPGFRIVDAVKAQALRADFIQPLSSSLPASAAVISLLKAYTEAFYNELDNSGSELRSKFPAGPERSRAFRHWLGTDAPPVPSDKIDAARNDVRAFLRALPSVAAYAKPGTSGWGEAWSEAEKELTALQTELTGHDFVFRDGANYAWLFDLAACGMPGWRSFPD